MKVRECVDCCKPTSNFYPIPRSEEIRCDNCHEIALVRGDRYAPGVANIDRVSQRKWKGKIYPKKKR